MQIFYNFILSIVLLIIGILPYNVLGFEQSFSSKAPIEIVSDSARYLTEQNKAYFYGKVEAVQDTTKLLCDDMEVIFETSPSSDTTPPSHSKKIKKIIFKGHVEIITPNETASSEEGEYNVAKEEFILRKNVRLKQGGNILEGDELIYLKRTGESFLTSNNKSKKVKGVFFSNKPQKKP